MSLKPISRTVVNSLVTHKTHFPLPRVPPLATTPAYPVDWLSKSLFLKTIIPPFSSNIHPLKSKAVSIQVGIHAFLAYQIDDDRVSDARSIQTWSIRQLAKFNIDPNIYIIEL